MSDTKLPEPEARSLLEVSPSTDFAGYHYETDVGRYVTFFWQDSLKILYASTLLKNDPSWIPVNLGILVAEDAKKNTPITAVNWSNGLKAAVYYLDDQNNIHERVSSDRGITWTDGKLSSLAVPTRSHSDLSAIITWDTLNVLKIALYFQDSQNLIRELQLGVQDGKWDEEMLVGYDKLHASGGTRIACIRSRGNRSIATQTVGTGVQEFNQKGTDGEVKWERSDDKNYLKKKFPRGARLGSTADLSQERYYAYESGRVTERIWHSNPKEWKEPTTLPTSTGTSRIFPNFIVLSWPLDMDFTSSEIHLFSLDEYGVLWDYLVGLGTMNSVSLLRN